MEPVRDWLGREAWRRVRLECTLRSPRSEHVQRRGSPEPEKKKKKKKKRKKKKRNRDLSFHFYDFPRTLWSSAERRTCL